MRRSATFIARTSGAENRGLSLTQVVVSRDALAEPVGSSLFFAGEATHPAVNPCIQAAYDTGIRVAKQVVLASKMQGSQSKL